MLSTLLPRSPRPWSRWLPGAPAPSQTIYVTTADGVRLAIHRIRPEGPRRESAPAVVLLHGLGSNGFGFLLPRRSLATWLAARGYDCFVPELRGAGESSHRDFAWDLDDYLTQDLPALLQGIREAAGVRELRWVGHSMGGLLLCCYAIRNEDHGLGRGVCVGSALDYTAGRSGFQKLIALRTLIERIPRVPFGLVSHAVSPLLGRLANPFEAFNFSRENVEPEVVRTIYAHTFEWIPMPLLKSLATTFEPGGFRSRDGTVRYLECIRQFRSPVLLVAGTADVQCPVEAVQRTAELIGPHATVAGFGRAFGHAADYGHFDLIVGRRAPEEVWPVIDAFLHTHAPTAAPPQPTTPNVMRA